MEILVAGLVIWSGVHLIPSIGIGLKKAWVGSMGEMGYKGSFAVIALIGLVLIVFGWRSADPTFVYAPLETLKPIFMLFLLVAFLLLGAAMQPTRINTFIRHPQLTGVIVWAITHLLLNGDIRSVVLFAWISIWAMLEILLINKRDGQWVKPAAPSWAIEIRSTAISLVVFVVFVFLHPYISGVAITG